MIEEKIKKEFRDVYEEYQELQSCVYGKAMRLIKGILDGIESIGIEDYDELFTHATEGYITKITKGDKGSLFVETTLGIAPMSALSIDEILELANYIAWL